MIMIKIDPPYKLNLLLKVPLENMIFIELLIKVVLNFLLNRVICDLWCGSHCAVTSRVRSLRGIGKFKTSVPMTTSTFRTSASFFRGLQF